MGLIQCINRFNFKNLCYVYYKFSDQSNTQGGYGEVSFTALSPCYCQCSPRGVPARSLSSCDSHQL